MGFQVVSTFEVDFQMTGGSIAETTWTFSRFGSTMNDFYNIGFFSDMYSLEFDDF